MTDQEWIDRFRSDFNFSHSSEDDKLIKSIKTSKAAIKRMTGVDDETNLEFVELVINRVRYEYNEQLEFFEQNFESALIGLSFEYNQEGDTTDDNSSIE
ncbi:phage gp6-like head-tail connector protein [Latilactobacillus curvatus]|uniref:phage gp6-like head-tail connector protein n=1 Tax=Latilactobacillus curvatus TaxID=28038 RepID=UPI00240FAEF7|nr:phage gp6-like head-tail connector protein [Latilactobacillus curvatus]MDG2980891.1 phage gp6-like head-tail connector protein [Latilactobacillus curvatus]WEU69532.1 putative head-tail connector protein [Latilactobacillus phage TMW 1.1365 P2]